MPKAYFLAPTRDCPPLGPIALGSIITSPANPELPLAAPLAIDENLMPVSEKTEGNWKHEISNPRKGKVGLWLSCLQMLGFGADASVNYERGDTSTHQFKQLSTRTFWPTKEYVEKSVMAPDVQTYLASKRFHHNVYMITSVSVAIGATVVICALRKRGIYLHFGVDLTSQGAPVSVGPEADVESSTIESLSFDGGSDFVFSFRLREICYTTRKGVSQQEFTKGALYGLDEETEEIVVGDSKKNDELEVFELLGLAEQDVNGEEVDGIVSDAEDSDGQICEVVKPMT